MTNRRENLDELLESIDMESYLDREGLDYKIVDGSSGTQLNVRECPVCGGDKYKVYLNIDTGLGNCFHGDCESTFNKWSFIKAHLSDAAGRDVVAHLKEVAREMGWRARRTHSTEVKYEVGELVMPESIELPYNGRNISYLTNRGIDHEVTRFFHLRYSDKGVFFYRRHDGEIGFQDYSKRVIIPIFDLDGELVSFQGRDITGQAEKKYLFPPGYASTGKYLYNAHNAFRAGRIVVNEGAFDVMAAKLALDEDVSLRDIAVVGSFGKHLSHGSVDGKDQLNVLIQLKAHGLREVTIMWDGEGKALDDAIKTAAIVHGVGLVARVAVLPPDKDPNEVSREVVRRAFYEATVYSIANALRLKKFAMRRKSLPSSKSNNCSL